MAMANNLTNTFVAGGDSALEMKACETLNKIFEEALVGKISDVHLEDEYGYSVIRLRKGNNLIRSTEELDHSLVNTMRQKIFSRSNISDAEADASAVDGHFHLMFPVGRLDVRVSCIPTAKGHSMVCRLLDQANAQVKIDSIEMPDEVRAAFKSVINQASGLVLVTGPTGSGKTTTLYSAINEINDSTRKILTIEHPVEYIIDNLQQINVNRKITFASALRAAMRQDPDVILIGEIRDLETAKTAIEAALTGHLVISTLHSNSALLAIPRLIDMGVDRVMLSQVLRAVVAQRLCLKLNDTRCIDDVSEEHKRWLSDNGFKHLIHKQFGVSYQPQLYKGRVPVIEFALITNEMRHCIASNNMPLIKEMAAQQIQYETLEQAGVRLAMSGITSMEEVVKMAEGAARNSLSNLRIGERLIHLGYATEFQISYMLDFQKAQPLNQRQLLGELLVEHNFCSQVHIDEALSE